MPSTAGRDEVMLWRGNWSAEQERQPGETEVLAGVLLLEVDGQLDGTNKMRRGGANNGIGGDERSAGEAIQWSK